MNSANANERHQDLDIIGRSDLALKLLQQRWFVRRIRGQRCDIEWCLGATDRERLARGGGRRHLCQRQRIRVSDDVIIRGVNLASTRLSAGRLWIARRVTSRVWGRTSLMSCGQASVYGWWSHHNCSLRRRSISSYGAQPRGISLRKTFHRTGKRSSGYR